MRGHAGGGWGGGRVERRHKVHRGRLHGGIAVRAGHNGHVTHLSRFGCASWRHQQLALHVQHIHLTGGE